MIPSNQIHAAAARESLLAWVQLVFPKFTLAPHIERIVETLERLERGEVDRLIICMPPRHSKSWTAVVGFLSWYLGRHSDDEVMLACHTASLAEGFSRDAREIVETHGEKVFGVSIRQDTRSAEQWGLTTGGKFHAIGVGGSATGKGASVLVVDDPIKTPEEADSQVYRDKVDAWFRQAAMTRLAPGGKAIVIMTRWQVDDLVGRLLQAEAEGGEQWERLIFPAIDDSEFPAEDPRAPVLWPARFTKKAMLRTMKSAGPRAWAAMYQQRPTNPGGSIFLREWFQHATERPRSGRTIIVWDCAFKGGKTSDFVVGQVWRRAGNDAHLIDQVRRRMSFSETAEAVKALARKHPGSTTYVEDKANGSAVVDALKKAVPGIRALDPKGGKESRAHAVTGFFSSGRVYFPDPEAHRWVVELEDELAGFPQGSKHDDQVDALSHALPILLGGASEGWWDGLVGQDGVRIGSYVQQIHESDYRADNHTYRDDHTGEQTDGWSRRI